MGQEAKESGASYELLNAFQGMVIFFYFIYIQFCECQLTIVWRSWTSSLEEQLSPFADPWPTDHESPDLKLPFPVYLLV